MRTVVIQPGLAEWRKAARGLLAAGIPPDGILWSDQPEEASLFGNAETREPGGASPELKVPAAFLDLAGKVSAFRDGRVWGVLYRLLWRLTRGGERHLLTMATDPEIRQAEGWAKAVRRDIHKMHAFVRFRLVGTDAATGREQFVAWFEPDHRIVRLASPFFARRFAGMDWSILTPDECVHWNGQDLQFTEGIPRDTVGGEDALDELWRTYYRNIFNPARVKVSAMQSEMPKKFWKNLPEARIIGQLISESGERVGHMFEAPETSQRAVPGNAYLEELRQRNAKESGLENP